MRRFVRTTVIEQSHLFCTTGNITAFYIGTYQLAAFFHEDSAAFFASGVGGLLPGHEYTIRIVNAAIIFSALFRLTDYNIASAIRTGNSDFLKIRLGILTVRESRAS